MRVPRIYVDLALSSGADLTLDKPLAHYLGRVLRLKIGRELVLFNGRGGEYVAKITAVERHALDLHVESYREVSCEPLLSIELAIGMSKGDRFDWVLQKATELGVSTIQPLFTERTEVRLDDRKLATKMQHWQGVVISACEQSGRTFLPSICKPVELSSYINVPSTTERLILHPGAQLPLSALLSNKGALSKLVLLVGPEGGLSPEEVSAAEQLGYSPVSLGPRVLRTETAPVAALAVCQALAGDF